MTHNTGDIRTPYRFYLVRNGVIRKPIEAQGTVKISCDADSEVKTSITGKFLHSSDVDWFHDRVQPTMMIKGEEVPLGEYVIITPEHLHTEQGENLWSLTGYDQGIIVKRRKTETRVSFAKGNRYTDIVQAILLDAGIERIVCEESPEKLQTTREDWENGTNFLTIINALLLEINYNSLWFDSNGNARISKYRSADEAAINHIYEANEFSILREEISVTSDVYQAYNVFQVLVSSPDYPEPLTTIAINDSPSSRISTVNIGRYPAPITKLDNIASPQALQDYADNLRFKSMMSTEIVPFTTANQPHSVRETIALNHKAVQGVYEEISWKMELSYEGQMEHTAKRVIIE